MRNAGDRLMAAVTTNEVAEAVAEGTVYDQDPARADLIPLRGAPVDDPHE